MSLPFRLSPSQLHPSKLTLHVHTACSVCVCVCVCVCARVHAYICTPCTLQGGFRWNLASYSFIRLSLPLHTACCVDVRACVPLHTAGRIPTEPRFKQFHPPVSATALSLTLSSSTIKARLQPQRPQRQQRAVSGILFLGCPEGNAGL